MRGGTEEATPPGPGLLLGPALASWLGCAGEAGLVSRLGCRAGVDSAFEGRLCMLVLTLLPREGCGTGARAAKGVGSPEVRACRPDTAGSSWLFCFCVLRNEEYMPCARAAA